MCKILQKRYNHKIVIWVASQHTPDTKMQLQHILATYMYVHNNPKH